MDPVWLALAAALLLAVGFVCTGWWLVADTLHHRRGTQAAARRHTGDLNHPAHLLCGQSQAITVAELLEKAARQGDGIRLNWPEADLDSTELLRPYAQDLFPTAVLPRVEG